VRSRLTGGKSRGGEVSLQGDQEEVRYRYSLEGGQEDMRSHKFRKLQSVTGLQTLRTVTSGLQHVTSSSFKNSTLENHRFSADNYKGILSTWK